MKFWLGVVSREHVLLGIAGNFVQVCHGKSAPLKRMKAGDWFIYYSPVDKFQSKEKLQKFTAIGKIISGEVYQVEMFAGFKPFRCDVDFIKDYHEVSIMDLKPVLAFTQGNYGMLLRRGHIEISQADFKIIASAMGVTIDI